MWTVEEFHPWIRDEGSTGNICILLGEVFHREPRCLLVNLLYLVSSISFSLKVNENQKSCQGLFYRDGGATSLIWAS